MGMKELLSDMAHLEMFIIELKVNIYFKYTACHKQILNKNTQEFPFLNLFWEEINYLTISEEEIRTL